jgi:uncharacterized membrane protein
MILATVFAVKGINQNSFWLDEGVSVVGVSGSTGDLAAEVKFEPQFGLYHLLLRGWAVFGTSEFVLRSFSVVCAVLTVPVLYAITRRLFDRRVATAAVAFLAVNRLFLGYGREARPHGDRGNTLPASSP